MWNKFNGYADLRNKGIKFSFDLMYDALTSAGIYDDNNNLIATLWSKVKYNKGKNTVYINPIDDFGNLLNASNYVVKILANYGITYEWLGVIGNSTDVSGNYYMGGNYTFIQDLVVSGDNVFYATGYSEGKYPIRKSLLSDFNHIENFGSKLTVYPNLFTLETDNTYIYGGFNTSLGDTNGTIISGLCAFNISDGSEKSFSSGSSYAGLSYAVGIDSVETSTSTAITINDIALSDNYIYIAKSNGLQILNKTTGSLIGSNSIVASFAKVYDSYIWLIHDSVCEKYEINSDGSISTTSITISVASPRGLTVDIRGNAIIADENVVNIYNDYTLSTTIGSNQLQSTSVVSNDSFDFSIHTDNYKKVGMLVYNSQLYICDTGNGRLQVFDLTGEYMNTEITFLGNSYCSSVDLTTNKVYHLDKEFTIDFTNKSYSLSRNWGLLIDKTNFDTLFGSSFWYVRTLSNNKLYAFVKSQDSKIYIFELTDTEARKTSSILDSNLWRLQNDNTTFLRYGNSISTSGNIKTYPIYKITITGFDTNNDPVFSSQETLYTVSSDLNYGDFPYGNPTLYNEGVVLFSEQSSGSNTIAGRYHLGYLISSDTYLWKTKMSTWKLSSTSDVYDTYLGKYPINGHDIGNKVKYEGTNISVIENSIVDTYRNEFWKSDLGFGQLNVFNHYNADTGLMIGQFGGVPISFDTSSSGLKGSAGNVFKNDIIKVDNNYYMFTNDENSGSGTHWWKIGNINNYEIISGSINVSNENGVLYEFSTSSDLNYQGNNSYLTTFNNFTTTGNSVRFTGFIEPYYSEEYTFSPTYLGMDIKMWVMDSTRVPTLVLDTYNNISSTILLTDGIKHFFILELSNIISDYSFSLSWSSSSQVSENIPESVLYRPIQLIDDKGIELLKGLKDFESHTSANTSVYGYGLSSSYSGTIGDNVQAHARFKDVKDSEVDLFFQVSWTNGQGYLFNKSMPISPSNWVIYGNYYFIGKNDAGSLNIYNINNEVIAKIWSGASAYDFVSGNYLNYYKEGIALNSIDNIKYNIVSSEDNYTINPKWNPKNAPVLSVVCNNSKITAQIGQYVVESTSLSTNTTISYMRYEGGGDSKISLYFLMKGLKIIKL